MESRVKKTLSLIILVTLVAACEQQDSASIGIDKSKTIVEEQQGEDLLSHEGSDNVGGEAPLPVIDALGVGHSGGANPHIALTPDQHITVALQHRTEGRIPEALAVLDEAIKSYPQSAQLHAVRSDIRRDNLNLAGALADIEQAVRLNPQSAPYLVGRSQLYLNFERMEEAKADLTRAIDLEPDLVAARFNRGTLYAHEAEYDKALVDLEACIAADPHLAAPYFNRGSVYYNLGRKEEAFADIERFIELADVPTWKAAGADLLRVWREAEISTMQDSPDKTE